MKRQHEISASLLALLLCMVLLLPASTIAAAAPSSGALSTEEDYRTTRSETVYVDITPAGAPHTVISSVYITNDNGAAQVTDRTTLTDIKNILGKEKPEQDGDLLTFRTEDGDDVCYQGRADAALPVSIDIQYTLDGQPMDAKTMAGKSGRVSILVKTRNHTQSLRTVDGEEVTLHTPFSVICVYNLNDRFSFIQTDNGKISAEAGNISVMSILNPGLAESLGLENSENIHDSLHIQAQVEDFELDSAMFIVMTGIVSENNLTAVDDVQELLDGIQELTDASGELYDGADELHDGAKEFADGLKELQDGVAEFRDGMNEYSSGVAEVYFGIRELADGAGELGVGVAQIAGGAGKMASQVQSGMADSSAALRLMQDVIASNYAMLMGKGINVSDPEVYAALLTLMGHGVSAVQQNMMPQLIKGLKDLSLGASELTYGANEFSVGARRLADGGLELVSGMGELLDAVIEMQDGVKELYDGAEEFADGTLEMRDGVGEMRDDGLQKMLDETADINLSLSRKDTLLALADEYTSFSCTDPTVSGSVQFIYSTDEVVAEKPIESPPQPEAEGAQIEVVEAEADSNGWFARFWNRIRGWFRR